MKLFRGISFGYIYIYMYASMRYINSPRGIRIGPCLTPLSDVARVYPRQVGMGEGGKVRWRSSDGFHPKWKEAPSWINK